MTGMTGTPGMTGTTGMTAARDLAVAAGRVVLGALFVYAAVLKLADLALFAEEIANYQMLPARVVPLVAVTVPGVEIAAGLLLALGLWARAAALVIGALLVVFIAGLSQALLRGIDLRCGCFGGAAPATWWTVARDVAMLLPAAAVLGLGPGRFALGRDAR